MASLNKVLLIGNLTRNPDLRYTPSGTALCELGLAVSRKIMVNGREQDEVCFVDITVWGKQAESCNQYLTKGSSTFVEGRLQLDQWEDKNGGGRRTKMRVVAERVQFLNTRRNDSNNGDYYAESSNGASGSYQNSDYANQNGNNYNNNSGYNNNSNNSSYNNGNNSYRNNNGYANNNNNAMSSDNYAPQMPPAMPEAAFNPSDDVEDDIPF